MSTLILAQNDAKIRSGLAGYREPSWDRFLRHHRLRYKFDLDIEILRSPAGEQVWGVYIGSANQVKRTIIDFANGRLARELSDIITIRIVFLFHQTHEPTVSTLMRAFRTLPNDPQWRNLPFLHNKHLRIDPVVLLSCESGNDKGFQPGPNPPSAREISRRKYAAQASNMRLAAGKAFVTPMAPPPTQPPGAYDPGIITFTTGNGDTGGIELNPFSCRLRALPGDFQPDGSWNYDEAGRPPGMSQEEYHQGTPTGGTIHTDHVNQGSSSQVAVPAGQGIQVIP